MTTYRSKMGGGLFHGPNVAGLPLGAPRLRVNEGRRGVSGRTEREEYELIQRRVREHNERLKRRKAEGK